MEADKVSEVYIPSFGTPSRHGFDFDKHLAVIAYESNCTCNKYVMIWDLDKDDFVNGIRPRDIVIKISVNAESGRVILATHSTTQV